MDTNKLLQLQEKIKDAEQQLAQLEGEKKQLLKTLKDEFGIDSIGAAEKELKSMQKDLQILENQIGKDYDTIMEQYGKYLDY